MILPIHANDGIDTEDVVSWNDAGRGVRKGVVKVVSIVYNGVSLGMQGTKMFKIVPYLKSGELGKRAIWINAYSKLTIVEQHPTNRMPNPLS
jgi:hypothetical protein